MTLFSFEALYRCIQAAFVIYK